MTFDPGWVALLTALISTIVALVSLIVSIRTERERVRIEAQLDIIQEIKQEQRNFLYTQLSEFYDPVFALSSVNGDIFRRIGPNSEVRWDISYPEEETAIVWNELVDQVITKNNARICEIIETKLHLISSEDNIRPYLEFTTHAHAYKVFRTKPYEAYQLFQFPKGFLENVQSHRNELRKELEDIFESNHP